MKYRNIPTFSGASAVTVIICKPLKTGGFSEVSL